MVVGLLIGGNQLPPKRPHPFFTIYLPIGMIFVIFNLAIKTKLNTNMFLMNVHAHLRKILFARTQCISGEESICLESMPKNQMCFFFDIEIPLVLQDEIYCQVKQIAIERIVEAMPYTKLPNDFFLFDPKVEVRNTEKMIAEDVGEGYANESEAIVKMRLGQGKFRTLLLVKYDHCVLCNLTHPKLLIASHIKRWCDSTNLERCDLHNALLLCPLHDKLFDNWMISFDQKGNCLASDKLRCHPDYERGLLNLPKTSLIPFNEKNQLYLEHHRNKFLEKNN